MPATLKPRECYWSRLPARNETVPRRRPRASGCARSNVTTACSIGARRRNIIGRSPGSEGDVLRRGTLFSCKMSQGPVKRIGSLSAFGICHMISSTLDSSRTMRMIRLKVASLTLRNATMPRNDPRPTTTPPARARSVSITRLRKRFTQDGRVVFQTSALQNRTRNNVEN